jgi:hypothetical protein
MIDSMNACSQCGTEVPESSRGRPRTYCSAQCRKSAEIDRRVEHRVAAFQQAIGGTPTREELVQMLWAAARKGSVSAMRALLEELRREPADQPEESGIIDELAKKRERP